MVGDGGARGKRETAPFDKLRVSGIKRRRERPHPPLRVGLSPRRGGCGEVPVCAGTTMRTLLFGTGRPVDVLAEGAIDVRLVSATVTSADLEPGDDVRIEP